MGLKEVKKSTGAPVGVHSEDAGALGEPPDFLVEDGDIILTGNVELRAIHTPCHTPGSMCYITGRHLFSGDTLFPGGPGRSSSPETLQQTIKSITEKLYVLPDETDVLPGHGVGTNVGVSKSEYHVFAKKSHPVDLHGDVLWMES